MDEQIDELLPLYALGALSAEERAQVEAYVATHAEARAQLEELTRIAAALPFLSAPIEPSARVKEQIMARVNADRLTHAAPSSPPASSRLARLRAALFQGRALPVVAGLSALVAIAALIWALALNAEVTRLRTETAALQRQLAAQGQVLAQILLPNVKVTTIAGTAQQPAAHGQLIANPRDNSAVLVVADLAQLQPGKVYQLWLIRGQSPISAGVFSVDEQGRAVLPVTSTGPVGSYDAVGVSIEPEGGSPQPTGDIVMLSKLS